MAAGLRHWAPMRRAKAGARDALTAYVGTRLEWIAGLFRHGTAANRRKRAIATLAGLVGALTLARAVDDPALSKEILAAARETFGKAA